MRAVFHIEYYCRVVYAPTHCRPAKRSTSIYYICSSSYLWFNHLSSIRHLLRGPVVEQVLPGVFLNYLWCVLA